MRAEGPVGYRDVLREVSSRVQIDDEERVRGLLRLIEQDHYIERDGEGRYRFRFDLIRRWWVLDRNLGEPPA